jgi:hypothetical protein
MSRHQESDLVWELALLDLKWVYLAQIVIALNFPSS